MQGILITYQTIVKKQKNMPGQTANVLFPIAAVCLLLNTAILISIANDLKIVMKKTVV